MGAAREDEELLSAFVEGEREAFDELVARHGRRVFQFALWFARETPAAAEDVAQEIWIEAFRSAPSFRGRSKFRTWLFGIGRNVCLNWMRRRGARREIPLETDGDAPWDGVADRELPALESLQLRENERLVRAAVEKLPPHHRVVLLLRNWEDLSYEEIADALDLPIGTVRSRLHHALKRLSAELAVVFEENDHGL